MKITTKIKRWIKKRKEKAERRYYWSFKTIPKHKNCFNCDGWEAACKDDDIPYEEMDKGCSDWHIWNDNLKIMIINDKMTIIKGI